MSGDEQTTHLRIGGRGSVPVTRVKLVVVAGPDAGLRHRLKQSTVRIGSGAGVDLRLRDRAVSRVHCELRLEGDRVRLVDLGSMNGTFVDGVAVRDADLVAGSALRIGDSHLVVEADPEMLEIAISARDRFGLLLGTSLSMRRLYAALEKIVTGDGTVLVTGETGTGKELVARVIHDEGARRDQPFVAVDCGSMTEGLVEAELFGHVQGAFTGATADRRGLFEQADGGTLFLDDVGELPLSIQPKLLRVLETREVRRIGAASARAVDVRVIASTKTPLGRAVNDGTFREDLYYRLAVLEISVPPLRARRDDIPILAQHFHEHFSGSGQSLSREIVASLVGRAWPGNVRQLRNVVERGITVGWSAEESAQRAHPTGARGTATHGGEIEVPVGLPWREARVVWTEQFERVYARALLEKTRGNVTQAAALAGLQRRSLQRILAQLGIASDEVRRERDDE
jgi:DNA-binding NtrC family response regulator